MIQKSYFIQDDSIERTEAPRFKGSLSAKDSDVSGPTFDLGYEVLHGVQWIDPQPEGDALVELINMTTYAVGTFRALALDNAQPV